MALDPQTLLFSMLLAVLLTAGACLLAWLQDRRQPAMLWMASACALGTAGIIARTALPSLPAITLGNAVILAALGLLWTACRSLRNLPPRPALIILPALLWLLFLAIPGFATNIDLRIVLACIASLIPIALAARELWHIERPATLIRLALLALLALQCALTFVRITNSLVFHHFPTPTYLAMPGFALVMIDAFAFMLLFSFGMIALVKEHSEQRLRDAAHIDSLTGISNRGEFEESLQRHFLRARKSRRSLSLVMIDVDDFKAYNDSYGHPAGDRCLRAIAQALATSCRPSDLVGRYGGEEFAVLLPDTDRRTAFSVAERMRQRVRALALDHPRLPGTKATISLGAASLVPWLGEATPEDLVRMADRALYLAKETGRNRTCQAPDEPGTSPRPFTPTAPLPLRLDEPGSA